jgi:aspartyl-tRNA(Asn)/glutamyl-tRNA(Gln) amidotransferase subunit C
MSEILVHSAPVNAFVIVSGVDTEIVVEFKVQLTFPVSATRVETTVNVDKKLASTFSEQAKEQIHISSSATVAQWRRVARLACIAIDENELFELCTQLNSIMSFVSQLSLVNVEGVEPMTSVMPMEMKKRADVVTDGGIRDDVLKNAPATEDGFFLVPKVVE